MSQAKWDFRARPSPLPDTGLAPCRHGHAEVVANKCKMPFLDATGLYAAVSACRPERWVPLRRNNQHCRAPPRGIYYAVMEGPLGGRPRRVDLLTR